ncbi:MAG: hypothetical protein MUO72_08635 [Bacteroidales bacterium]|nr:hypothetical protein [Bacteroidales bacterium]
MYISDMTHFLNEKGNIPKEMPTEARELASFFALVVDCTTKTMPLKLTPTAIRCFNRGCHGLINTTLKPNKKEIHWYCPECENEGVINNWEGTKWNNNKK